MIGQDTEHFSEISSHQNCFFPDPGNPIRVNNTVKGRFAIFIKHSLRVQFVLLLSLLVSLPSCFIDVAIYINNIYLFFD